ncbi:hypothetical protein ACGTRS_21115 [Burkholderia semiarida]|uniref:Uncharacterized protein n=1 Tax=Burkholderia semiarida TaxID=2843303 RepID=A0ABW7LBJ8_9BURK|nr:hypothetical protein [Burkholderia sp. AU39826]MCA7973403.1 hypothetical protein [Burkholderia sp. AU39826]
MLHRSPRVPTIDARATSFRTLSHFFAFFILTTPLLRIVTVERPFRSACGTWCGVSRENEHGRGWTR